MHRRPNNRCVTIKPLLAGLGAAALVTMLLSGCSPDTPVEPPAQRTVKIETVRETVGEGDLFTGVVRQRQRADLAFELPGLLTSLRVDVGDKVKKGQVLATLDGVPAQQRLRQARANAESGKAQMVERESNYQRQQRLYAAGSVAQSLVEAARAEYVSAVSQQRRAAADLELAKREVEKGQLSAPFTGRVVSRRVDAFTQLAQGQAVLTLESDDDRQVVVAVPVSQTDPLKPGDIAQAYLASPHSAPFDLLLEGVSARAEDGLLQSCIFRVLDPSVNLPSGVTVLVRLKQKTQASLSIPVSSLLMGQTNSNAKVFVYQPAEGTVVLRNVTITSIEGGRAQVGGGLAKGESVVAAGAAFLFDGQAVDLYRPLTRLAQD